MTAMQLWDASCLLEMPTDTVSLQHHQKKEGGEDAKNEIWGVRGQPQVADSGGAVKTAGNGQLFRL